MPAKTKPIIPNSRNLVAETIQADIRKADAQREAARAMLAALERFTAWNDKDQDEHKLEDALNAARRAIAAAKAAGIEG